MPILAALSAAITWAPAFVVLAALLELPDNPYAEAWYYRYAKARGLTKFLGVIITRYFYRKKIESRPVPITELAQVAGVDESTVQRHLPDLGAEDGDFEIIKPTRRGTTYRYRLRQALRLPWDEDDRQSARHQAHCPVTPGELRGEVESAQLAGCEVSPGNVRGDSVKKSEENPRDEGDRVVDDRSVEDSRSRSRSTDRGEGLPAAQRLAALLADAYRAHHAGARLFISAPDLLKLRKLLTQGFSEDDVLKMAEVMWTITRTEDRWLFAETQERGVKLLVHAATRLHRIATERAGTGRLDLQPSPSDSADVVSARVHELLLKATTDEELYERWLAPLTFVDAGAKVIVCTPTLEHRQHVMTLELEDKLLRAITEVLGPRNLEFYVDRDATKATVEQPVNNREARG